MIRSSRRKGRRQTSLRSFTSAQVGYPGTIHRSLLRQSYIHPRRVTHQPRWATLRLDRTERTPALLLRDRKGSTLGTHQASALWTTSSRASGRVSPRTCETPSEVGGWTRSFTWRAWSRMCECRVSRFYLFTRISVSSYGCIRSSEGATFDLGENILLMRLVSFDRATILLHDPHADPSSPFCKSSEKLLFASRQILDLVYILCSTSFDVTLLDPVASFAWFLAARVLVRFLKAKIEARKHAEAVGLRNELEVIRLALKRVGERIPLGCECPIQFEKNGRREGD